MNLRLIFRRIESQLARGEAADRGKHSEGCDDLVALRDHQIDARIEERQLRVEQVEGGPLAELYAQNAARCLRMTLASRLLVLRSTRSGRLERRSCQRLREPASFETRPAGAPQDEGKSSFPGSSSRGAGEAASRRTKVERARERRLRAARIRRAAGRPRRKWAARRRACRRSDRFSRPLSRSWAQAAGRRATGRSA